MPTRERPVVAGAVTIAVAVIVFFFAFTRLNPLSHPFKLVAVFQTSNNLRPGAPVRIAGVDVGKVKSVSRANSSGGARVEMEIEDSGLPIHKDAVLKIRPRIFLEGNFFVDLRPGSPSAPTVDSGDVVPINQTATPVQLGDVLSALESDTRSDLQTLLKEYAAGLRDGGAAGFNQAIRYWKPAYRDTALVNEAALGVEPDRDLQRLLRGQERTFGALAADEGALRDLVTNLDTVASALASQNAALGASVPALRDTLRTGFPALHALDAVLPSLRAFAREALPGVRSTDPALDAGLPFVTQLRALVAPSELGGSAAELRRWTPSLAGLTKATVPLLVQARALSACTADVLAPFITTPIPDPDFPDQGGQTVNEAAQHSFVGLGGESRQFDGNGSYFSATALPSGQFVRPAPPPDGGSVPPPHRPDVPCETQELPNLEAPSGLATQFPAGPGPSGASPVGSGALPASLRAQLQRVLPELRRRFPGGGSPPATRRESRAGRP